MIHRHHRFGYLLVLAFFALATGGVASAEEPASGAPTADSVAQHAELFARDRFPSAEACRTCHPEHYRQWAASQHAYAMVSPVFNAMQGTITRLTNGTNGDFCIRCHTPQGMAMSEPTFAPYLERAPVSREGVTCIACHRQDVDHGKFSARSHLIEGDLNAPVYGPTGGAELERVLADSSFRLVTESGGGPGRPVHSSAERFFALTTPAICATCHDVTSPDGFRLEEAFSEFKTSSAARAGHSCQDCHMGIEPGDPASGYDFGPAAIVGGVPTRSRKLTNHMIAGPDHTIVHPALFPHSPAVTDIAPLADWLSFDHEAGWGTDAFEDAVGDDATFPAPWDSVDARYDAREVLDRQVANLAEANDRGTRLLRKGYQLGEVEVVRANRRGMQFRVEVKNGITSHNVPTGFTAERVVFLRVTVTDPNGQVVFRSGDLDADGNLRDLHSELVRAGRAPLDRQLFSLQSRFVTRNLRGSEREQVLAVNHSVDALPFLRPETISTVLTGRPRGARIHKLGIPPGESRWARYKVPGADLGGGAHRVDIELVAGMVPVNLIQAIDGVGFDHGMTTEEVAQAVVAGHRTLWSKTLTIDLPQGS